MQNLFPEESASTDNLPEYRRSSWIAGAKQALSKSLAAVGNKKEIRLEPRPPEGAFKRSGVKSSASAVPSSITFERYNMTSPALLGDMKAMLSQGLEGIEKGKSGKKNIIDEISYKLQVLQVHQEVFQKFIEECNIYRPILSSIKHSYEQLLEYYASNFGSITRLHAELAFKDELFADETRRLNELSAEQMKSLVEQRLTAQKGEL